MRPVHGRAALSALGIGALAVAGGLLLHRPAVVRDAGGAPTLPVRRAPTTMPAGAHRLAWWPVAGEAPAEVTDYTRVGDTLVVLDARSHRVLLLRPSPDGWRAIGGWGRRGGGPGEFQRPAAIAGTGAGEIAVLEAGGRIQLFDPAGRLLRAERAPAPCAMFAPTLAYGPGRVRWLAGNCPGGGGAQDTIFTLLYRAVGDGDYAELLRLPRMAADLSWGSVVATLHPLGDAGESVYFGTGLDDCVHRVPGPLAITEDAAAGDAGAVAERRCALVRELLHAPAPARLEARRRQAERSGQARLARLLRWPDALPPYLAVLGAGDRLLLARPVGPDSLALVAAGEPFDPARAALVAPLGSFVTCARGSCLWYDDAGRLALYEAAASGPPARGDARAMDANAANANAANANAANANVARSHAIDARRTAAAALVRPR